MNIFCNALNSTENITCFMEQVPSWEADRYAYSQEFQHILWNQKVHFRIHKCPPPVPILSQLDPGHTTTSYLLKTHITIIGLSTSASPHWCFFPTPMRATCPAHFIHLNFITRKTFVEQYITWIFSLCRLHESLLSLSLLGTIILLYILFPNNVSLRSSLNVRDQVSHPYKTTAKL